MSSRERRRRRLGMRMQARRPMALRSRMQRRAPAPRASWRGWRACMSWHRSTRSWKTGWTRRSSSPRCMRSGLRRSDLQHRIVLHLMLQSMAGIAALMLCAVLVWWLVQAVAGPDGRDRSVVDHRSMHTLRTVVSLAIEVVTLVLRCCCCLRRAQPDADHPGTGRGGLTVVFQNFILAFFGWFVLMGRNGIRVGDWVEINGVAGEVVEVGLFRTTLLETGNWTDKGHPTGRRVRFLNSFAVTGQFFNFSTAGQWMWDEISVNVPAGEGRTRPSRQSTRRCWSRRTEGRKAGGDGVEGRRPGSGAGTVLGRAVGGYAAGSFWDRHPGALCDARQRPVRDAEQAVPGGDRAAA
jgi:hypothetical protein